MKKKFKVGDTVSIIGDTASMGVIIWMDSFNHDEAMHVEVPESDPVLPAGIYKFTLTGALYMDDYTPTLRKLTKLEKALC